MKRIDINNLDLTEIESPDDILSEIKLFKYQSVKSATEMKHSFL